MSGTESVSAEQLLNEEHVREQSPGSEGHPQHTPRTRTPRKRAVSPAPSTATARRVPAADQRGCVFKSSTQRFRSGDIMGSGGVSLIRGHDTPAEETRHASDSVQRKPVHRSPHRQTGYSLHTTGVRKRHAKPSRWKVEEWNDRPECVGRTACDASCVAVAESTVWCAERDGTITIREKDGCVFAIVERDASAPEITSLLYVSSTLKGGRIIVGHANGTVLSLDASTAERCSSDVSLHSDSVTCLALVYQSPTSSLAISASLDGTVKTFDVFTLQPCTSPLVHPAPVSCVVSSGPYTYTGCDDGHIRKWDSQTGIEASLHGVGGAVNDLVLGGRYLWACVSGASQISVIDTVTMLEVTVPQSPTSASAVKVLMVGQACWVCHEDSTIAVWNVQTLEMERIAQTSAPFPVVAVAKVTTIPEDYEVWTLTTEGEVNMWRNHEYTLPLWCSSSYTAWEEELADSKEKMTQLRAALRAKTEDCAQMESLYERLKEDMLEQSQLQQSVQNLVDTRSSEVDVERERRKRVEVELSEIRQCVISAHKELAPPTQHLLHYKLSDVKGIINWLAFESNSTQRQRDTNTESASLQAAVAEADVVLSPDAAPAEHYTEMEVTDVMRRLTASLQQSNAERDDLASRGADGSPAHDEVEVLRSRNGDLEEDNARLKDMLEKLKVSHRRVNSQLQALSQGD